MLEDVMSSREIPHPYESEGNGSVRRSAGARDEMKKMLPLHWKTIVNESQSVLVSAKEALKVLKGVGLLQHVSAANGLGDVLGQKGFKLPFVNEPGGRKYLIPALGWNPEEIAAFLELSGEEIVAKVRLLQLELLGDTGNGSTGESPTPAEELENREGETERAD